jgi:hypothetical protein
MSTILKPVIRSHNPVLFVLGLVTFIFSFPAKVFQRLFAAYFKRLAGDNQAVLNNPVLRRFFPMAAGFITLMFWAVVLYLVAMVIFGEANVDQALKNPSFFWPLVFAMTIVGLNYIVRQERSLTD